MYIETVSKISNLLQIILFGLKAVLIYVIWISMELFGDYFSIKSKIRYGTSWRKSQKVDEDFYKNFYQKTSQDNLEDDRHSKEEKLLINKGIDLNNLRCSMKYFNINNLPINDHKLKNLYRDKAKICHPDAGGCNEDFMNLQKHYKKIQKANSILKKR